MGRRLSTQRGTVIIRPAEPDDAARLHDLRVEALASHPTAFAADAGLASVEPVESWAERIVENQTGDRGVICVAEVEDRLIGMTGLGRGHWPKTRHSAIIWGVYVHGDWRGFGVAQALLDECITWGQAHGVVVVKLGVATTNTPAIRCYARAGFAAYGLEPKAIFYEDVYYDELLMSRSTAAHEGESL